MKKMVWERQEPSAKRVVKTLCLQKTANKKTCKTRKNVKLIAAASYATPKQAQRAAQNQPLGLMADETREVQTNACRGWS